MDAGFVAQSVRTARQTGLQWEQPDEAGPFSCARRARPSDAVRLAPAWNTSSLRVRAACRRTVQRRKGGGYGGWINSYFFFFFLFFCQSAWIPTSTGELSTGDVFTGICSQASPGRDSLCEQEETLNAHSSIWMPNNLRKDAFAYGILWLWEAERSKPLGKMSKSFDSFALGRCHSCRLPVGGEEA